MTVGEAAVASVGLASLPVVTAGLEVGALVHVRGQQWVVSDLSESSLPVDELAPTVLPGRTLVTPHVRV